MPDFYPEDNEVIEFHYPNPTYKAKNYYCSWNILKENLYLKAFSNREYKPEEIWDINFTKENPYETILESYDLAQVIFNLHKEKYKFIPYSHACSNGLIGYFLLNESFFHL